MPEFVQSVANQQLPPPYSFPGVKAHGFLFEIPMSKVQAYCDTFFNLGTADDRGFVYRCLPLFPYACLMAIDYPVMRSECSERLGYDEIPFSDRGYACQREIFVAVPVMRYGVTPGNILVEAAVEWVLPFIAVDNSTSAFSGREMLGLPKLQGLLEFDACVEDGAFQASAKLPGWSSLDDGSPQQELDFLSIATGPALGSTPLSNPHTTQWQVFGNRTTRDAFQGLISAVTGVDTFVLGLLPTLTQVVALKQFRDATRPGEAVYQALVGARVRYANVGNLKFFENRDAEVRFYEHDSFRQIIRTFLDLPSKVPEGSAVPEVRAPVEAAFSFTADIEYDVARAMHTFFKDGQSLTRHNQPPGVTMLPPWWLPWRGFFAPK